MVYKDPGEQAPMVLMDSQGEFHEARNVSHWLYQKHHLFPSPTFSENTNWETAAVHLRVAKKFIRKARDRFNYLLE